MDTDVVIARGMRFLFEADGFLALNKFENAMRLYEAQIISLRSVTPVDTKMLAICYGRLGKLYYKEEKYDRSISCYDRQLSLANEIQDKPEAAEAYLGIGLGYLGIYQYDDAVRYLESAQVRGTISSLPVLYSQLITMFDRRWTFFQFSVEISVHLSSAQMLRGV